MAKLDDYSRFKQTPLVEYNNQSTYDKWVQPTWLSEKLPTNKEGSYNVSSEFEGKPDLISNFIYGTPKLYWVLIAYNNAEPFGWPRAGETIKYPSETVVFPELLG